MLMKLTQQAVYALHTCNQLLTRADIAGDRCAFSARSRLNKTKARLATRIPCRERSRRDAEIVRHPILCPHHDSPPLHRPTCTAKSSVPSQISYFFDSFHRAPSSLPSPMHPWSHLLILSSGLARLEGGVRQYHNVISLLGPAAPPPPFPSSLPSVIMTAHDYHYIVSPAPPHD